MLLGMLPLPVLAANSGHDPIRLTDGVRHEQGPDEKTAPTFRTNIDRDALPESARDFTRIRVMSHDGPLELETKGVSRFTNWSDYYNGRVYNSIVPYEARWSVLTILYDAQENALAYHAAELDLRLGNGGGRPSDDGDDGSHVPSGKIDRLEVSEHEIQLSAGQIANLKVYAIYTSGAEKDVTKDNKTLYRTDAASIANVAGGLVKAGQKEGRATIIVNYEGKKVTVPVNVTASVITQLKSDLREITMESGELHQVSLTAIFSNGTVKDVTSLALWTTDDSTTADVELGEIEAVGTGHTMVTAFYGGYNVNIAAEVVDPGEVPGTLNEAVALEASNKNIKMKANEDKVLEIYAVYDDGSKEDVTDQIMWQTSKSDVADAEEGVITAGKPGKAIITANYDHLNLQITVQVEKEKPIRLLSASSKSASIKRGGEKEIVLTAVYTDSSKADVTDRAEWSSKNEGVAEAEAGVITGKRKGSTVITARYNGKIINITVKVS